MNKDLILAEWRRVQDALRPAELLMREGCYADAVSRAYYAVFHAAKAALHTRDVNADTHPAVRRMFGLYLIKTGEIEKEYAVHLGESFDDRHSADCDFLARIRRFLRVNGFAAAQLRRKKS